MTLRVAVTGLNAVDSPGPGVPILRSLKESSLKPSLLGLAYDVLEPGNFMDGLIDSSYIIPYPNASKDLLLERIVYIHEKKKIDVIIPALDSELDNFIGISEELNKKGIKLFLPDKQGLKMRDKTMLKETLNESDVLLPETYIIQDSTAIAQIAEKIGFPMYVKGIFYEAYFARTLQEAIGYFYYLAGKWGIPIILQQSISGEEINTCAFSRNGKIISHVVMKKMYVTDKGKAWAGVTIKNPDVSKMSEKILQKIGWNGGCELEYIMENKTGKIYLLEINPRFPAWVYLTTAAGLNLPDMLLRASLGEDTPVTHSYNSGIVFVRHSWDEIVPMKYIESLTTKAELNHKE